ncbi:MAG: hypothetical protein ACOYB2_10970 [Limnohabitans sp.]
MSEEKVRIVVDLPLSLASLASVVAKLAVALPVATVDVFANDEGDTGLVIETSMEPPDESRKTLPD